MEDQVDFKDIPKLLPADVSIMALTIEDIEAYLVFLATGRSYSVSRPPVDRERFHTRGWAKKSEKWLEISTPLDSGGHIYLWIVRVKKDDETHSKLRRVELANQEIAKTAGYVCVDLKLKIYSNMQSKELIIEEVNIYLIEGDFTDLLIGRDILQALGATPEQVLLKTSSKEKAYQLRAMDPETEWKRLLNQENKRKVLRGRLQQEIKHVCSKVPYGLWMDKKRITCGSWQFKLSKGNCFYAWNKDLPESFRFEVWIQPPCSQ
eukprot:snap_masked-scaffold_70-processed-gene-0.27-mRNA-1 protein AED:1.00 eAED:1.00 QI:0/0/0/0/1/1/2/0/262